MKVIGFERSNEKSENKEITLEEQKEFINMFQGSQTQRGFSVVIHGYDITVPAIAVFLLFVIL